MCWRWNIQNLEKIMSWYQVSNKISNGGEFSDFGKDPSLLAKFYCKSWTGVHVHSLAQMPSFPLPSLLSPVFKYPLLLDHHCPWRFSGDPYQEPYWTEREVCYEGPETLRPKAQKSGPEPGWPPPGPHLPSQFPSCMSAQSLSLMS